MKIEFPDDRDLPALAELWSLAFGDPLPFIRNFFDHVYSPQHCRCIKDRNGQILSVLYWFDAQYRGQQFAYLYAIATHPAHQKKGLCRMLMEDTHRLLESQGCAGAFLMPGKESLRLFYQKLGYRDQCQWGQVTCQAGSPAWMEKITPEEYARLRRTYLSSGGAIQEGPILTLLGSYVGLYKGADFLLAAVSDEDKVFGAELLGNISRAEGIVRTLRCRSGTFRIPGQGLKGAMYFPLTEGTDLPEYFGIVAD